MKPDVRYRVKLLMRPQLKSVDMNLEMDTSDIRCYQNTKHDFYRESVFQRINNTRNNSEHVIFLSWRNWKSHQTLTYKAITSNFSKLNNDIPPGQCGEYFHKHTMFINIFFFVWIHKLLRNNIKQSNKMYLRTPGLEPATSGLLVVSFYPRRPSDHSFAVSWIWFHRIGFFGN